MKMCWVDWQMVMKKKRRKNKNHQVIQQSMVIQAGYMISLICLCLKTQTLFLQKQLMMFKSLRLDKLLMLKTILDHGTCRLFAKSNLTMNKKISNLISYRIQREIEMNGLVNRKQKESVGHLLIQLRKKKLITL